MKLNLIEDKNLKETIVDIKYNIFDQKIKKVIEVIETNSIQFEGIKDNNLSVIESQNVFYIESVDNSTFLYTEADIYENKEKLYFLEEQLQNTSFIRINKSTILNMDFLESVNPLPNYRLEANLANGEKLIINRHYIQTVKQYLNI